ncbi:FAD-dependent monooxygenase [Streptomyces sp. NPDC006193]|uniref:FAD-dependent monooxygenase n=1 Tax=Streptomyces sp. NPDC006193 TaxID=3155717 RepID=UPI0033B85765
MAGWAGEDGEDGAQTDFCVVGAGPAGLTVTLLLLRSGARVTLVERSASQTRAYRGEILQPGGLRILDALGVLGPARAGGCHELDGFQLLEGGRVVLDSDYRRLPAPWNHLLSIPQEQVLGELLARCRRYRGFTLVDGSRVTRLHRRAGRVSAVVAAGRGGQRRITAHCFVAADGRYSKTRSLAGIAAGRDDVFEHDVLWFKVPAHGRLPRRVRIERAGGNPVLTYPSGAGHVQIGWLLPHRTYGALAARGVEHVKDLICAAVPQYADEVRRGVRALTDLTLLDVFASCAPQWAQDGLLLIGDSAHTHSPVGAQGINLALQDAVAAHPVLMASLRRQDATARFLQRYTGPRRRDIRRVMRIQRAQSSLMLSTGRLTGTVRPALAGLVSRTPLYRQILRQIAFGNRQIRISSQLFTDTYESVEQECV